jgi:hypothetical protein
MLRVGMVYVTGKDVLSKFVHGSTNEPAARKAVQLLDKCGVKGVGTRGHFYDKMKSVVIGILLWRMVSAAYDPLRHSMPASSLR